MSGRIPIREGGPFADQRFERKHQVGAGHLQRGATQYDGHLQRCRAADLNGHGAANSAGPAADIAAHDLAIPDESYFGRFISRKDKFLCRLRQFALEADQCKSIVRIGDRHFHGRGAHAPRAVVAETHCVRVAGAKHPCGRIGVGGLGQHERQQQGRHEDAPHQLDHPRRKLLGYQGAHARIDFRS